MLFVYCRSVIDAYRLATGKYFTVFEGIWNRVTILIRLHGRAKRTKKRMSWNRVRLVCLSI